MGKTTRDVVVTSGKRKTTIARATIKLGKRALLLKECV
jgi:ribosomal protein S9